MSRCSSCSLGCPSSSTGVHAAASRGGAWGASSSCEASCASGVALFPPTGKVDADTGRVRRAAFCSRRRYDIGVVASYTPTSLGAASCSLVSNAAAAAVGRKALPPPKLGRSNPVIGRGNQAAAADGQASAAGLFREQTF
eukprot:CAMPEP_0183364942 /NCGR_PEP_ID=MMETSP0164_2-20130417/82654_1 /TAXON_ID=221442 /ORGANISM="Coccolithus pelagicus ssp braarudi, Strain PLY182g" /LENGTH=139 /DNA_ID=CAMNT_0025540355 /DNA_START=430 /DNA_END=848 /DNA_ORIENTATION=+